MIALRIASLTSALATMVLNAHYGWTSSSILFYAVMFAILSVAFDVAKSSLLVMASRAYRNGAYLIALLCFLLFWPCLTYSLHAGLSQVAKDRGDAKASAIGDSQARARKETEHKRLLAELATMEANPIFKQTAACGLTKTKIARDFCARVDRTKAALSKADGNLTTTAPNDPEPNVTMFAEFFGWPVPNIRLGLALWPVLLAELCGSLGFYLSSRLASEPAPKPSEPKAAEPSWWRRPLLRHRPKAKTAPKPPPDAPQPEAKARCTPNPAPTFQWPTIPRPETP